MGKAPLAKSKSRQAFALPSGVPMFTFVRVSAREVFPSRNSYQHGLPLLGRVRVPTCSPTSTLVFSPPTPWPRRRRLRFPSPVAYLTVGVLSGWGRSHPQRRNPCGDLVPAPRWLGFTMRKYQGLPGYWAVLVRTCRGRPPRRLLRPLAHIAVTALLSSGPIKPWTIRIETFVGCIPTAHTVVCLRINHAVTGEAARLTSDLPGSALVGLDLNQQDDSSEFLRRHRSLLFPTDQQGLVASIDICSPVFQLLTSSR